MAETKRERREHARELAKANREAALKLQRRNRWFLQGGVGAGILAAAGVALLVVSSVNTSAPTGGTPSNTAAGAIAFHGENGEVAPTVQNPTTAVAPSTEKPTTVDLYIDWSCPMCKQFETANAADLQTLVASEQATLAVHPVAILDRSYLGSRFSSRAANAAACVADRSPSSFLDVQQQMYDNQPEEGTRGLTTSRILELVHAGGGSGTALDSCIKDETYRGWVQKYTAMSLGDKTLANPATGGFGTPTALINGTRWNGGRDFIRAVEDAE
ncbi:thioredoxin domain-containing protein [Curtobacterium flaccumfaciens pv. flaccumfaciens]|uniref:DsbA family protein n=1 Tax=Curtobacterium flaccumfaciens TaxID=2035 RepID=UPI001BDE8407|nr:thioredoxin domain-containing protein [Curtobacterium flaccumfaciens]MBT1669182.1 thioredoxin domain-containing protein [Curtobacterium flaccumfaciens pv. flaccumfaciens]